jgi:hypothetical protein
LINNETQTAKESSHWPAGLFSMQPHAHSGSFQNLAGNLTWQ